MCPHLLGLDCVSLSVSLPQIHPQRNHHQLDMLDGLRVPADDALREHVDDECGLNPPGPGAAIREVHHPDVIRPGRGEVTVQ